jgi:hypothetical protein
MSHNILKRYNGRMGVLVEVTADGRYEVIVTDVRDFTVMGRAFDTQEKAMAFADAMVPPKDMRNAAEQGKQ